MGRNSLVFVERTILIFFVCGVRLLDVYHKKILFTSGFDNFSSNINMLVNF